jgi:hypothetical protein
MKYTNKLLFLCNMFLFYIAQPQQLTYEKPGSVINLSNHHYDKHHLLLTTWAKKVIKVDANMKEIWNFEIKNEKDNYIYSVAPYDNGIYLIGQNMKVNNQGAVSENYPFVISLNTCLDTVWHKIIASNNVFNDTVESLNKIDIYSSPRPQSAWVDEWENLYFTTISEDLTIDPTVSSDSLFVNISYLYKFSKSGEFIFRKKLINVPHSSPFIEFVGWVNGNMLFRGCAFYRRPGKKDTYVYMRAVILEIDTAGSIINYKDYREDDYFTGTISSILYHKLTDQYFAIIRGSRWDSLRISDKNAEMHFVKLNRNLQETYRQTYSDKESNESYSAGLMFTDTSGNICSVVIKEFKDQNPNTELRTRYEYFTRVDTLWNIIDSTRINFLKNNLRDTIYSLFGTTPNPHNPNSIIFNGYRRQGANAQMNTIVFKLNATTFTLDTVLYQDTTNDWRCSNILKGSYVKTIFFNDTLVFNRRINSDYRYWMGYNNQGQLNQIINLSPNPATTQVHIESPIKIENYTLTSTSGKIIQSDAMEASNSIDISRLPSGLYFLQLHLANGQTVMKKVVKE